MVTTPFNPDFNQAANGLRLHFFAAWLFYWLLTILMPFETSWSQDMWNAFFLQASFVSSTVFFLSVPLFPSPLRKGPDATSNEIKRWILWALLLSFIGLALQIFDKVIVQGVDYSNGIASAREQLKELGEARGAQISSVASVAAHLIGSAYFIAVLLLAHEKCLLTAGQKFALWACVLLLLIGNLGITGGRSGLLFLISFSLAMCSRRASCATYLWHLPVRYKFFYGVTAAVCLAYVLYVFYARATLSGVTAHAYTIDFLQVLGLSPSPWFKAMDPASWWSSLLSLITLAGGYLTHSLQTTAAIVAAPVEDKVMVFSHLQALLAKTGLVAPPDTTWFLSGLLPSLPGALYHQLGLVGVLLCGALLGFFGRLIAHWHSKRSCSLLLLSSYALCHATLVLSPLLFAADFVNFPFIATSAVAIALLSDLTRRWDRRNTL